MKVGEKIRHFRIQKKITMKELGEMINLSEQAIGNYERGDRTPKIEVLRRIAEALDVPLIDIIGMEKLIHTEKIDISKRDQGVVHEFIKNRPENYLYSPSELEKKNKEELLNLIKGISKLSDIKMQKIYTDGVLVDWEITEEGKFPIYDDAGLFGGVEVTYKNKTFTLTAEEYYKLTDRIIESIAINILAAKEY